jgi:hypothetical protein
MSYTLYPLGKTPEKLSKYGSTAIMPECMIHGDLIGDH